MHVSILPKSGFRTEIHAPDIILKELNDYFTDYYKVITFTVNRYTKEKTKQFVDTSKCHFVLDKYSDVGFMFRGLTFFAIKFLVGLKSKYPELTIDNKVPLLGDIKILPKWEIITKGKEGQYEALTKALTMKSGAIQLPTGFGKTEMFLATIESYLEQFDGNVVVTIFRNSVGDTIKIRMKKYGLLDNPRIKILNAVGFMKSKSVTDPEMISWMNNVKMIIHDEAHHIVADSYISLFRVTKNVEYVYAYSATISQDDLMNYADYKNWKCPTHTILSYSGVSSVHKFGKDIDRQIDYVQARGYFGYFGDLSYTDRVKEQCASSSMRGFLRTCMKHYHEQMGYTFFIPIPYIEAGSLIHDFLVELGYHSIYWSGKGIRVWSGETIKTLDELNHFMSDKVVSNIIATAGANEGVDLHKISGSILLFGKDEKFPIQASGRAGRDGSTPLIINVYNEEDSMFLSQSRQRHNHLKTSYELKSMKWKYN